MNILYLDCFSGASGNMFLGALLDLNVDGANEKYLIDELNKLGISGWHLKITRTEKNYIGSCYVDVHCHIDDKHDHDHKHDNHVHHHNSYKEIRQLIEDAQISDGAKKLAQNIFLRVARAESKVHGKSLDEVHFHEVGAVDSIIDIVGTAILIDKIAPEKIYCSVVNDGFGFVESQHGTIPVPVPATAQIFAERRVPTKQLDIPTEMVTPTGAAIIAELSESFGKRPQMNVIAIGYGAGTKDFSVPNVLRIFFGTNEQKDIEKLYKVNHITQKDSVIVMETNIDNTSPEILAYTMERLFSAGALDVFFSPIQMKKNRPGTKLTIIAQKELTSDDDTQINKFSSIIFEETGSLGIRYRNEKRIILHRKKAKKQTNFGEIEVKVSILPDGKEQISAEYESAKKLAQKHGLPIKKIYESLV